MFEIKYKKAMLLILSVFMILIVFMGSTSAIDDNAMELSQNIDEIHGDNTDISLSDEVSSAGDNSGLSELDNDKDSSFSKSANIKDSNVLKANNDNTTLSSDIPVTGNTFADIQTAIDGASAGDTILLNGKYDGNSAIQINKNNLQTIVF